jgi:predicted ATP-grasp superfamily ATP-dependent carboligase
MSQWSRLKDGYVRYPSHYKDEESFVRRIGEICVEQDIRLILPSHNETEVLARHRHDLPPGVDALLPAAEHCALFNHKGLAYDFVDSLGLPVPKRIRYRHLAEIAAAVDHAQVTKTVIKLLTGNSAKGVRYADSAAETQRCVMDLVEAYALETSRFPQLEERVDGEGWGVSVLYWHGQSIASFTHRRLREKIATGGTSTLREVAHHSGIEEVARRIFDRIGWHGLAMCEFKVCPETGRFWFIEVNPRLWGSIALAISAGVEFPYLAWLCATQGPEAALDYQRRQTVREPWRSRWLLGDLSVAASALLGGKPRRAWETLFHAKADYTDDVFWDDPLVFPGEITVYLSNAIRTRSLNAAEKGMVG